MVLKTVKAVMAGIKAGARIEFTAEAVMGSYNDALAGDALFTRWIEESPERAGLWFPEDWMGFLRISVEGSRLCLKGAMPVLEFYRTGPRGMAGF